jgi:2-furoyl-CoA dehydrogenase large subunit
MSVEPVAVVVAENRYLAEDVLDLIKVTYETLPATVDIADAIREDAPVLHPQVGSNIISDRQFRYGDPEAAFQRVPHRVKLTVRYPRNSCTPIECAVVIAEYLPGDEGYEVTSNYLNVIGIISFTTPWRPNHLNCSNKRLSSSKSSN